MNIGEIIKKFPRGTKLYSTVYGDVVLVQVNSIGTIFTMHNDYECMFLSDGKIYKDGECVLFPSKEERNWDNLC